MSLNHPELLNSVQALTQKVQNLDEHVTISEEISAKAEIALERAKLFTKVALIISLLVLGVGIGVGVLFFKVHRVTNDLQKSVEAQCRSDNIQAAQNLKPWKLIIDGSVSQPSNQNNPEAKQFLEEMDSWLNLLFQPRDCRDLSKTVKIPDPPKFPVITPGGKND